MVFRLHDTLTIQPVFPELGRCGVVVPLQAPVVVRLQDTPLVVGEAPQPKPAQTWETRWYDIYDWYGRLIVLVGGGAVLSLLVRTVPAACYGCCYCFTAHTLRRLGYSSTLRLQET